MPPKRLPSLAPQEQRVLGYVGKGYTTDEIAKRLGVSRAMAAQHVSRVITFVKERGRRRASEPVTMTPREQEVLALLRDGATNAAIAAQFGIGQRTAETHVANVLRKTGASSRRDLKAGGRRRMS